MLNRFRWWLAGKLQPRMNVIVRFGKTKRGKFRTVKQFIFRREPTPKLVLDCEFLPHYKVDFGGRTFTREEILGMIEYVTAAEGSLPKDVPPEYDEHGFAFPNSKNVDQDIIDKLRESL